MFTDQPSSIRRAWARAVAPAGLSLRDLAQLGAQGGVVGSLGRLVSLGRAVLASDLAGPTLGEAKAVLEHQDRLAPPGRALGLHGFVEMIRKDKTWRRLSVLQPRLARPGARLETRAEYLTPALEFFDGLKPNEGRFRWDRLIALDLVVMCFLNDFGYDPQKSKTENFIKVAGHIENPKEIGANLIELLRRLHLEKKTRPIAEAFAEIERERAETFDN